MDNAKTMIADVFPDYQTILREADELLKEDRFAAADRATIAEFYNGLPIQSQQNAEDENQEKLVNHLFGFDNMNQAVARITAVFSQRQIWKLNFRDVDQSIKDALERRATELLNRIIHRSGRLQQPISSLAGDATLFGRACLMHHNMTDWCPQYQEILVPYGVKARRDDVPYFIVPSFITRKELEGWLAKPGEGWNKEAIQQCIDILKLAPGTSGNSQGLTQYTTTQEVADARLMGQDLSIMNRLRIPTFNAYVQNPATGMWDLIVIPRYSDTQRQTIQEWMAKGEVSYTSIEPYLYHGEKLYDDVCQLLYALFLETNIGGDMLWHKVMGLGRLNLESDADYEDAFNQMMTSAKECLRRLYKVSEGSDPDSLNSFFAGSQNIIPQGVDVVEVAKMPNYQHILGAMNMLRSQSNAAAAGAVGASSEFNEDLQVQAVERQQRQQDMMTSRMTAIYRFGDDLGREIVRRFFLAEPSKKCESYDDIMEFRDEFMEILEEYGVPEIWDDLTEIEYGQLCNIIVSTNRAPGDGNTLRAIQGSRYVMERLFPNLAPQSQQDAMRNAVALETGDEDLAEQLVPRQPEPMSFQTIAAMTENNSAASFGFAGAPMPIQRTDVNQVHIPLHIMGLEALNRKGQAGGWDRSDVAAAQALGSHTAMHIQEFAKNPQNKQQATAYLQQLQAIAREAQVFLNQVNEQEQKPEMDPYDAAKLQLEAGSLQLKTRQQDAIEVQRLKQQDLRERDTAFNQAARAKEIALKEQKTTVDNAAKVAKTVVGGGGNS